ncbi:MAG TPA: glycosyltransferase family 4 protein [Dermatophilaceae bacterium]|nr:glycosyltransferase family 4 protein [Dermatophilaceae bacterium]
MTDCYLPRLGGIEVQVGELAARLVRAGHDIEVFTATIGADGRRGGAVDIVDGIPVHRLAVRMPAQIPWNPWEAAALRCRLAELPDVDVAHVHMGVVSPFAVDATRVLLALGIPTTMTWHCMLGPLQVPFSLLGVYRRWAARGVAMNAVSAVAAAPVQRVIGEAGRVAVLPNGIDLGTWWAGATVGSPPSPRAPSPGGVRIVTAMRLAPRKRPLALLRVVRAARELVPQVPIRLTVLGEGPVRGRMERYLTRHGMSDWVELAGRVSRPELLRTYRDSHLYLTSARLESFGIAALEARCAGLPVVAMRDSGAVEFVLDGVNGYLAADDAGLARAVARLVRDDRTRQRMVAHNLVNPPEQDWGHVLDLTLSEYRRARALRGFLPASQ